MAFRLDSLVHVQVTGHRAECWCTVIVYEFHDQRSKLDQRPVDQKRQVISNHDNILGFATTAHHNAAAQQNMGPCIAAMNAAQRCSTT